MVRRTCFRIQTLAEAHSGWSDLLQRCAGGEIYHREQWLALLARAYGLKIRIASLVDDAERMVAGGVFAESKNPFRPALISLPFSDSCPFLAVDRSLLPQFAAALADQVRQTRTRLEVRGYSADSPWMVSQTFLEWSLDLARAGRALHGAMARNFRRQVRAGERGGLEIRVGRGAAEVRAFHDLMFAARQRLGLPVQPLNFFKLVAEIFAGDCEIWLGAVHGLDCAGMLLLRDRDTLHCKWSARADVIPPGANHLLFWRMLEAHAQRFRTLNLGRTDASNQGLNRFKSELGASATALPYSFFPHQPARLSSEAPSGAPRAFIATWQRLPRPLARFLGPRLYPYLT